jgi:hypothetical protein
MAGQTERRENQRLGALLLPDARIIYFSGGSTS